MIYITGDTHGDMRRFSTDCFPESHYMTKNDYVVILGDFGLIWSQKETKEERYWLNWLDSKPFTTLFVDGNHENFNRLNKFPMSDMFGSRVGKISNSIFHLFRGEVYNIDNQKIFTFGGGLSVDKMYRVPEISWWKEEYPSQDEMDNALHNLEQNSWEVDYIFTHTGPKSVFELLMVNPNFKSIISPQNQYKFNDAVSKFLDHIYTNTKFKRWYCGHYHVNLNVCNNFTTLYEKIIKL